MTGFDWFDDFIRSMTGVCRKCGVQQRDLRPWPPDNPNPLADRFCGTCRCRMAVEGTAR